MYRLVNTEGQAPSEPNQQVDIVGLFNQLRTDVCTEISEIKKLLPTQTEAPQQQQKGGNQNDESDAADANDEIRRKSPTSSYYYDEETSGK